MAKAEPITTGEIQQNVTLREVMDCFFEGALAGYAGGGKYELSQDILGGKVFSFPTGKLVYIDTFVSNGPQSGGMTVISLHIPTVHLSRNGLLYLPLWMMQYEGEELTGDKAAIELVKAALRETYKKHLFFGGRGLPTFLSKTASRMCYYNNVDDNTTAFSRFSGREAVVQSPPGDELFYHNYSGKLLVPLT